MKRAIRLARLGLGRTYPNPPVGAIVVKDGRIVSQGYHLAKRKTHAEALALSTTDDCQGADLYITLEPCSTRGKTGPCTSQIIAKGIRRVFVGTVDPSEKNGGRAREILKKNGIVYEEGVCREDCEELIAPFKTYCKKKRPWVTLKAATTWDSRISGESGRMQISSEASIRSVHRLRSQTDAILIGTRTFLTDNPRLTIRRKGFLKKIPLRIVFFSGDILPEASRLFECRPEQVLIVSQKDVLSSRLRDLGVQQWCYSSRDNFLGAFMKELYRRKIVHLLLEGGGGIYSLFLKNQLVDDIHLYVCPLLMGQGPLWLPDTPWSFLKRGNLLSLKNMSYRKIGVDFLLRAQVNYHGKMEEKSCV